MKRILLIFALFALLPIVAYSQSRFDISLNPGIDFVLSQEKWVSPYSTYEELNEKSYFSISGDFLYNFNKTFSGGASIAYANWIQLKAYSFQAVGRAKLYDKYVIPFVEAKFGFNVMSYDGGNAPSGNISFVAGAGAIIPVSKIFGFKAGLAYKFMNPNTTVSMNNTVGNEQGDDGEPINASFLNLNLGVNFNF